MWINNTMVSLKHCIIGKFKSLIEKNIYGKQENSPIILTISFHSQGYYFTHIYIIKDMLCIL